MCEQKLSVFSADYWRAARRELNNPRVLAFSGLVCAMAIVLESLPIYLLGPSLKIYFSFLAVSLGCMCYGPVVGMMAGAIIDTVGFLLASYGEPYFPGYLITAMLSGLIYGVMLYRQKPTLPRIIVTRLIINYGSNVLLGSVWKAMLYGKGYLYYFTSGLVKNTTMLPIEAKFEFGLDENSTLTLMDEVLTPDSSRFWSVDTYKEGTNPPSFDKQFVRDWLEQSGWNKQPPAPKVPKEVIEKTVAKYQEALDLLTK